MTHIAMERSTIFAGKPSISIRAIYTMAMLVITRGYIIIYRISHCIPLYIYIYTFIPLYLHIYIYISHIPMFLWLKCYRWFRKMPDLSTYRADCLDHQLICHVHLRSERLKKPGKLQKATGGKALNQYTYGGVCFFLLTYMIIYV